MYYIIVLSCTLQTTLVDLLIFILSGKNDKSQCNIRICFGDSTSTLKIYPIPLFSLYFFINSSLNFDMPYLSYHLKFPSGNVLLIAYPYKLLASRYTKYDDTLFLS